MPVLLSSKFADDLIKSEDACIGLPRSKCRFSHDVTHFTVIISPKKMANAGMVHPLIPEAIQPNTIHFHSGPLA